MHIRGGERDGERERGGRERFGGREGIQNRVLLALHYAIVIVLG